MRPLLIFDPPVVVNSNRDLWQEWVGFGLCVLPQGAAKTLQDLAQGGGPEESQARAFWRWQPHSEMQIIQASALAFSPETGGSARQRLETELADCAYTLAKQHSGSLVVLVSDQMRLRQRVQDLQVTNLGAISGAELRQWLREQQRPAAIEAILQRFPGVPVPVTNLGDIPKQKQVQPQPPAPRTQPALRPRPSLSTAQVLWRTLLLGMSLVLLTGSGLVLWRLRDPAGSESFWRRWNLPDVPGLGS
ncbi:MAG: hypothetical protein Q6J68_00550 [Thermostichales cyanobacterium SZTDM-1c_bins_54]